MCITGSDKDINKYKRIFEADPEKRIRKENEKKPLKKYVI